MMLSRCISPLVNIVDLSLAVPHLAESLAFLWKVDETRLTVNKAMVVKEV